MKKAEDFIKSSEVWTDEHDIFCTTVEAAIEAMEEYAKQKKAFLFSFTFWHDSPDQYLLVYAETEKEAREIGRKQCEYNSGQKAHAKDLRLCTWGLDAEPTRTTTG